MLSLIIYAPVIIAFLFLKHVDLLVSCSQTTFFLLYKRKKVVWLCETIDLCVAPVTESGTSLELTLSSYSDGDSDDDCLILV